MFFTDDYLIVETVDQSGASVPYAIFFDLKKARDGHNDLIMTVESAYMKTALPKHLDKIRFRILAGKIAGAQGTLAGALPEMKKAPAREA